MKKVILLAVMAVLFISCLYGQINESPKINYQFCEIVGNKPFMASKMKIIIDYGLNGETETVNYKSMVETLNVMVEKGWVFVQAYTAPVNNGNNMFYYWILKREIKK